MVLFCGAFTFLAMTLIGLWQVEYIAFQDYPSHLLRSYVLRYYQEPQYNFGQFFSLNWGLIPNQAADVVIFIFSFIFSIEIATRLFFSVHRGRVASACRKNRAIYFLENPQLIVQFSIINMVPRPRALERIINTPAVCWESLLLSYFHSRGISMPRVGAPANV